MSENTTPNPGSPPVGAQPAAAAIARARAGIKGDKAARTPRKAAAPKAKAKGKRVARAKATGPKIVKIKGVAHDVSHYQKATTALGNSTLDSGDDLAVALRGKELDDVYSYAAKQLKVTITELKAKYARLNPGMQRMNLGNRVRAAAKRAEAAKNA